MSGTLLVPSESLGDSLWYPIDRLQKDLFKFGLMELTDIFSYSTLWGSLYNSNCVLEFWQAHLMLTEKCQTMSFGLVKLYFSSLVLMSGHSEKRRQELLFLLLESLKSRVRHRHVALKVATNSGDTRRQQAVGNHCTQSHRDHRILRDLRAYVHGNGTGGMNFIYNACHTSPSKATDLCSSGR